MSERRRAERFAIRRRAVLHYDEGIVEGQTENLSTSGCMLSLSRPLELEPRSEVYLRVELPGLEAVPEIECRVAWCSNLVPGLTGLSFPDELPPVILDAIERMRPAG